MFSLQSPKSQSAMCPVYDRTLARIYDGSAESDAMITYECFQVSDLWGCAINLSVYGYIVKLARTDIQH